MEDVFIAPGARVVGKVKIGRFSSVWFNAVLRGDKDYIKVGSCSNIQDNATVHTSEGFPVEIGDYVSIGHNSIVHGAKIGNFVLVGMGAIIMNGAEIGERSIVGAGALVTQGKRFPPGSLIVGFPAEVRRKLTEEEKESIKKNAESYCELARQYANP